MRKKCIMNNCPNNSDYYRDLDDNSRPICSFHFSILKPIEMRHYRKIQENRY